MLAPGKLPPHQFITIDYLAHLMGIYARQARSAMHAQQLAADLVSVGMARWTASTPASNWELEILNGPAPRNATEVGELIASCSAATRLQRPSDTAPVDRASGGDLDRLAMLFDVVRHPGEPDDSFRSRLVFRTVGR